MVAVLATAAPLYAGGPELKTEDDKTLYALGLVMSRNLATFNLTPAELDDGRGRAHRRRPESEKKVDLDTYGPKIQQLAQAAHGRRRRRGEEGGPGLPRQGRRRRRARRRPTRA